MHTCGVPQLCNTMKCHARKRLTMQVCGLTMYTEYTSVCTPCRSKLTHNIEFFLERNFQWDGYQNCWFNQQNTSDAELNVSVWQGTVWISHVYRQILPLVVLLHYLWWCLERYHLICFEKWTVKIVWQNQCSILSILNWTWNMKTIPSSVAMSMYIHSKGIFYMYSIFYKVALHLHCKVGYLNRITLLWIYTIDW